MTYGSRDRLDEVDWAILRELQADARLSFNELARRVHLSAPSVAERVRRMEGAGVITGYRATVAPAAVGWEVSAFVQMRCDPSRCLLKTTTAADFPEVVEIRKLSGDHCAMLRVRAVSVAHLEEVIERLGAHGAMRTSVVLSTQYEQDAVGPPPAEPGGATPSQGWPLPGTAP